jgi:hypothetical protein
MTDDWLTPGTVLLDAACPLPLDRPFTAGEAGSRGVGRKLLRRLLRRRLVREVLRGVYVAVQVRDSIELKVAALRLVVAPSAVVTDRTAAWLQGVDVLPRRAVHEPVPLDVFSRAESRLRRPGVDSGIRELRDTDVEEIDGIAVTSKLRTALDLGRRLPRYDAIGALDALLRAGVCREELEWGVHRFKGHRGVIQLRDLVPLADPRAESMPESALRLHGHDAGLTLEPQFVVCDAWGRELYRLDLAAPEVRYGAEYNGVRFHEGEENEAYDQGRAAWLDGGGWEIDAFWNEDLYGRHADPGPTMRLGVERARVRLGAWHPQGHFLT